MLGQGCAGPGDSQIDHKKESSYNKVSGRLCSKHKMTEKYVSLSIKNVGDWSAPGEAFQMTAHCFPSFASKILQQQVDIRPTNMKMHASR